MGKLKADTDIERGTFDRIYLIYGEESYLVRFYMNRLKKAIIPEEESMNYAYFDAMPDNVDKITDFADTMPFFGDRRLVVLDKANAFKKDMGLADYVPSIPETTTIIVVEEEVDKRSRLYKAIQKSGTVMELKKLGLPDLRMFVGQRLMKAGKRITEGDCNYLLESVGDDLNTIVNEVDKCIAYAGDGKVVDKNVIDSVCSMQVENKIFDMVDAILRKDGNTVFKLYSDLVTLRENTFGIMAVIRKNYNRLLQIRELMDEGCSITGIAEKTKTSDWIIKKQAAKVKGVDGGRLRSAIQVMVDTEYDIKIGNIGEQMGLEIMLAKLMKL